MAQVILGNNLNQLKLALKAKEDLENDLQNLIRDLQNAKAWPRSAPSSCGQAL